MNSNDYYNLGSYSRAITTTSTEAQMWFDRGLIWCYSYNHEESVKCFQKAAEYDADCAMVYWGIAYASGPNYNKPWEAFTDIDMKQSLISAHQALELALLKSKNASAVEYDLIHALKHRYQSDTPDKDCHIWNDDYAEAMRDVYQKYPDDIDVASLFVEALINRTPWELWDIFNALPKEGADTLEAIEIAERTLQLPTADKHPGILHMYIHIMEMSPHPEKALAIGDLLRDLVPDAGHLRHMPTHIDVLCGDYQQVVASNEKAIIADRKFLKREGAVNFYSLYRCHNYHFKLYGAMFLGQYQPAIDAADEMISTLPRELLEVKVPPMADWLEGFVSMKMHVLIRFGKWQEIKDAPLPEDTDLYCVTTAMMRYAKGVACAASGDVEGALLEKDEFERALKCVPDTRYIFNNTCLDILAIAAEMLKGELAYRQGYYDKAYAYLRKSVELDDNLPYDEPWGWMQPTRHALGALLLEQGHVKESEAVYRADLGLDNSLPRPCQHPNNVWSLHGLHECLVLNNKSTEAALIEKKLATIMTYADVPIQASCYCRTTH